jgi:hypothetical protein
MQTRKINLIKHLNTVKQRQKEETGGGCCDGHWVYFIRRQTKWTVLKIEKQYPLVLLVKVGWMQGEALGSEEGKRWTVD